MKLPPWQRQPLDEWSICGMHHYRVAGERFLFVSMVKDGHCITEEGLDNEYLWNRLWRKADEHTRKVGSLCEVCHKKEAISVCICSTECFDNWVPF